MTLLKYWALGTVYMVLLSLAIVAAAAASLGGCSRLPL